MGLTVTAGVGGSTVVSVIGLENSYGNFQLYRLCSSVRFGNRAGVRKPSRLGPKKLGNIPKWRWFSKSLFIPTTYEIQRWDKLLQRMHWNSDTLPTPLNGNVFEQRFESQIGVGAEDRLRTGWA
jgi:hypothetical protein